MAYWLFKTEPDEFSIEDLQKAGTNSIRNYGARNRLPECEPDDLEVLAEPRLSVSRVTKDEWLILRSLPQ